MEILLIKSSVHTWLGRHKWHSKMHAYYSRKMPASVKHSCEIAPEAMHIFPGENLRVDFSMWRAYWGAWSLILFLYIWYDQCCIFMPPSAAATNQGDGKKHAWNPRIFSRFFWNEFCSSTCLLTPYFTFCWSVRVWQIRFFLFVSGAPFKQTTHELSPVKMKQLL